MHNNFLTMSNFSVCTYTVCIIMCEYRIKVPSYIGFHLKCHIANSSQEKLVITSNTAQSLCLPPLSQWVHQPKEGSQSLLHMLFNNYHGQAKVDCFRTSQSLHTGWEIFIRCWLFPSNNMQDNSTQKQALKYENDNFKEQTMQYTGKKFWFLARWFCICKIQ